MSNSEEVVPTSVQLNEINYPTNHVQLPPPKNDILLSNTQRICQLPVPIFNFGDEKKLSTFNSLYGKGRRV